MPFRHFKRKYHRYGISFLYDIPSRYPQLKFPITFGFLDRDCTLSVEKQKDGAGLIPVFLTTTTHWRILMRKQVVRYDSAYPAEIL